MTTASCADAATAAQRASCQARQIAHLQFALAGKPAPNSSASASNITPVTASYSETGKLGDAESWKTDEFMQDWGLAAINAQHAYARGLTGSGIRIGLFDSGVALGHGEFSGKNHQGLIIGNLRADGTRCTLADSSMGDLANPDSNACFASDGGRPSIEALYWDPAYTDFLLMINPVGAAWATEFRDKTSMRYDLHGTHVAGTMAASRDGNGMHGVAFGADFSSARLFGDSFWHLSPLCIFLGGPGCQYGQFADNSAFEDMYSQMNANGVRAINHSWGLQFEPYFPDEQDAFYSNPELQAYWEILREGSLAGETRHGKGMGLIQVWAAGNHEYLIPSLDVAPIAGVHASLPRHMPELEKYWLSVANVQPTGDLSSPYILSNSSMKCGLSMEWCLAAPGTKINSAFVDGLYLKDGNTAFQTDADGNKHFLPDSIDALDNATKFGYKDLTGTSMAAPHVTGALALLF
ncbi:MAG: S8 family peptidase, partial [Pseudomonadota bacterium]|nr:S8 family peptidase [Pseudomonadota bacterium]